MRWTTEYGLALRVLALGVWIVAMPSASAADGPEEIARTLKTLREETDREALADAAVSLAKSKRPEALRALGDFLTSTDFLGRLHDDSDYRAYRKMTRIVRIMAAIGE